MPWPGPLGVQCLNLHSLLAMQQQCSNFPDCRALLASMFSNRYRMNLHGFLSLVDPEENANLTSR